MRGSVDAELSALVRTREARVGVIGLGYVGLPLALAFAEEGFSVLGFDVDSEKIGRLGENESYIGHVSGDRLAAAAASGRFEATDDFDRLPEADAILICVPTPLGPHREPDLTFIEATADRIAPRLRRGQIVILESTTYPGTTDGVLAERLRSGAPEGIELGRDVFVAYSPEREDPGNPRYGTRDIPKVVGGVDPVSGDVAAELYRQVVGRVVPVSSSRAAEATKLVENIFRAVNIALSNELKVVYDAMGIDVWEILDAAETKPFGYMRFDPGPGWGGHCIPLDPFYLTWKAREFGITPRFIELAGEVNLDVRRFVVRKVQRALNERGKAVRGSRILVIGLAYKRDVDDPRESPAFALVDRLLDLGGDVKYHDPHIPVAPAMRSWPHLPPMRSVELTREEIEAADVVLVVTDHSSVDWDLVGRCADIVVDTRGVVPLSAPGLVRA